MATQAAHKRPLVSGDRKKKNQPVQLLQSVWNRRCVVEPQREHGGDPRIKAPVDCFDVHLQAVSTRRSMAALLTDKRLFSSMFGSLVHTQLRTSQEGLGTLGTL